MAITNTRMDDSINKLQVTAVLLAAGMSTRFGEGNKLLAACRGKPLIAHTLDAIIASPIERMVIVLGYEADTIQAFCNNYLAEKIITVTYIVNAQFESGMGSSLQAGISCVLNKKGNDKCLTTPSVMVFLADMPNIDSETINTLLHALGDTSSTVAYVPTFEDTRGHPVLMLPSLFHSLLGPLGDQGARQLLQDKAEWVQEIAVRNAGIQLDVDTPDELSKLELRP